MDAVNFDDMVSTFLRGDEDLHEYLVDKLIGLNELKEAARWARKLNLAEERTSGQILSYLSDVAETGSKYVSTSDVPALNEQSTR